MLSVVFSSIFGESVVAGIHPNASSGLSDFGTFLEAVSAEGGQGSSIPHWPCSKGPGATSKPTKIVNSLLVSGLRGMSAVKLRSGM